MQGPRNPFIGYEIRYEKFLCYGKSETINIKVDTLCGGSLCRGLTVHSASIPASDHDTPYIIIVIPYGKNHRPRLRRKQVLSLFQNRMQYSMPVTRVRITVHVVLISHIYYFHLLFTHLRTPYIRVRNFLEHNQILQFLHDFDDVIK